MRDRAGMIWLAASVAVGVLVAAVVYVVTRSPSGPVGFGRSARDVRSMGACEQCHSRETPGVMAQYLSSKHAEKGVGCADCHAPRPGLATLDHHGFTIVRTPTAGTCAGCHRAEYDQFVRSRHAMPAMTAVSGNEGFTPESVALTRRFHPEAVDRPANSLPTQEGPMSGRNGCIVCHRIGRQNADGSIGTCTMCHGNHVASAALADVATTCGSCHMGPDHSQLEIWGESRHGVLSALPDARARGITPTCSTCHMSGAGEHPRVTHDVGERLSYYLFAPVSTQRPNAAQAEAAMRDTCLACHARSTVDDLYNRARGTVENTNHLVSEAAARYNAMVRDGCVTPNPWDEPADIAYFELWHHYGRTAKHGAFMGGADYVQWHGNYEIVTRAAELRSLDEELRRSGRCPATPSPTPAGGGVASGAAMGGPAPGVPAPSTPANAAPAAPNAAGSASHGNVP